MKNTDKKIKKVNYLFLIITIICAFLTIAIISASIFGIDLEANTIIEFGDNIENNNDEFYKQDTTIENVENSEYLKFFKKDN